MIGRKPICARISAAIRPHGPVPMTTGAGRGAVAWTGRQVACVGRGAQAWVARKDGGFVAHFGIDGVDQLMLDRRRAS